jgi:propionate CoA-transferase
MRLSTKVQIIYQFLKWRATWDKRNTKYRFSVPGNPKFMSARDAIALIPDGAVVCDSGLGATQRASILYWAIKEVYQETGHPKGITLMGVGGHGGRGRIPGTLEELGEPGLVKRLVTGHTETYKAFLKLAAEGQLEIQVLPQGMVSLLIAAQGEGKLSLTTTAGKGTFVDPRCGRGTPLVPESAEQLVTPDNGHLSFRLPPIEVAIFNLPAADKAGNLYAKNAAMVGEAYEAAKAAKKNGGIVIANVGKIVDEGYDKVFLPATDVDAIVYDIRTEQTGSVRHSKPWMMFTPDSTTTIDDGMERIRFINGLVGVTPVRSAADWALARLAATVCADIARSGASVNIGVGLPEEVSRLLYEAGLGDQFTMMTESGAFGGMAAPGIFFGTAVNPREIVSSCEAFRRIYAGLDITILGLLEADSAGNVNVSKRGDGPMNYVGPGGFIDITTNAKKIIFCGSWMNGGKVAVEGGQVRILERGKPKFMPQVSEVTFSGAEALKRDQEVYYVTNVGAFQLTPQGMQLRCVFPGIDIQRDILDFSPMHIIVPEGEVPVVPASVVTGQAFKLSLKTTDEPKAEELIEV